MARDEFDRQGEGLPDLLLGVSGGGLDDQQGVDGGWRHLAELGLADVQPAQDAPRRVDGSRTRRG
jgi:hypothetical protein